MAALIYGGGLRDSECCQLRVKDLDFDQGLVFVRSGKGNKDRSTLLAEVAREELRAQLRSAETLYRTDRESGLTGVWMPDALERKYPNRTARLVSPRTLGKADGRSAILDTVSSTAFANSDPRPGRRASYQRCDSSASVSASGRKRTGLFTDGPGASDAAHPTGPKRLGSRDAPPNAGRARPPALE